MPRHSLVLLIALLATPAAANPLTGKTYISRLSSAQYASGYGDYLLPPLVAALKTSGMKDKRGPGADVVVNVDIDSDVGKWVGHGTGKVWTYPISATVGISPEAYEIPITGTPAFGIRAKMQTPNPDRQDEMDCLIKVAAQTALNNYRATGIFQTDGSACQHK